MIAYLDIILIATIKIIFATSGQRNKQEAIKMNQNNWIRASTNMPQRGMDILIIYRGKIEIGWLGDDNLWHICGLLPGLKMEDVIWWQYLPGLPKE